ncbi:MAG: phytoene/squalene synthase family protein [Bacteroidales bacterium]
MDLYLRNAIDCSRITTRNYSTSFASGIRMLHRRFHDPVYAVYGFVRYADEIVDTFFEQDQQALIREFREAAFGAIQRNFSTNPILHSFQWVVNRYRIDHALIDAFLRSMEMDLEAKNHDRQGFSTYVYGSAEVVGLMCLKIFCDGDDTSYSMLTPPARRLGEAFQKVNFLRDLRSDFVDRGRTYFPDLDMSVFDQERKQLLEKEIQDDFNAALEGIRLLRRDARLGVYITYAYYLKLFRKIQKTPATALMEKRIRIPNCRKFWILLVSYLKNHIGFIH